MELKNNLSESRSPYLREAADQPVHWQIYSEEAFRIAKKLDRPILLDIGAVWCHWCHVMDNESYSDMQVAEIINKHFVAVKVDRDQMPDVDARYQMAVGALTGAGGWPLTGFLTCDGKAFYGGTYFPKDGIQGRQGLLTLLPQIAEVYANRREDVFKNAEEIADQLKEYQLRLTRAGELSEEIIDKIVDDARSKFDKGFGGFGIAPKFFNPTTLHLLAEDALNKKDHGLRDMVVLTLDCIARGGVYDQVGGGFHRYSVDRYWHVPHFEKMLYDNALMLEVYLMGLQLARNQEALLPALTHYANVARETADWMITTMQSPDGPFYAHQDADVETNDDGTYWTWTKSDIETILTKEESEIAEVYFDVREEPEDTHGFPERNVLRIAIDAGEIVKSSGKTEAEVAKCILSAKKKLQTARGERKAPFIDKTYYADRNGLAISALVEASLALKAQSYFEAAESAASFIMDKMVDLHGKVAHAFSGESVLYHGLLDDHVYFGTALLDLFDVARDDLHINAAEKIAQTMLDEFSDWIPSGEDKGASGFFDRPSSVAAEGLLATQKKPVEDTPTPSGNSGAAIFFDRLFGITENRKYFEVAERTLKAFAGSAADNGIYSANYARALRLHLDLLGKVR